jgi:hypothetical protein
MTEVKESSVGVIGWLGFVIINFAAFGIIGAGTVISWMMGFVLSGLYTAALVTLAFWLHKRGTRYRQFTNLLWVLGCLFVFIDGFYLAFNLIGTDDVSAGVYEPLSADDLASLLPENSSEALRSWVRDEASSGSSHPGFETFGGHLFFVSPAGSDARSVDALWRSDATTSALVQPHLLANPRGFVEFGSRLYFAARSNTSSGDGVWFVGGASPTDPAQVLFGDDSGYGPAQLGGLFADGDSSSLFLKVAYSCGSQYIWSIFKSDGTSNGTVNLRGECAPTTTAAIDEAESKHHAKRRDMYWGIVLLAAVPMITLATVVMLRFQMPGLFANLYWGVAVVATMVFLLAGEGNQDNLLDFNRWFYTTYNSALYVVLIVLSVVKDELPEWLEEMKSWAVAIVGVTFFVIIHFDVDFSWDMPAWGWAIYAVLALLQMASSVVLSRALPMVCGSLSAFVISWKISSETVELLGGDSWGEGLRMLATFSLMALLGIGVIMLGVAYAERRSQVERAVRSVLRRSPHEDKANETPSGTAGDSVLA